MSETIAGVRIPDSALAAEATDLVREAAPPMLYDHSRRVYLFGVLQGRRRGMEADPELLYVGAMFHDLGLTETYRRTDQRFELDGADEARRFLASHGVPEVDIRKVWEGIALHTTPEVPYRLEPEVALVTAGVETDVLGIGYRELDPRDVAAVTAATHAPTSSAGSSRPSPTGSRIGRRRLSARSTPTSSNTSFPASSTSTSSTSSRTLTGPSDHPHPAAVRNPFLIARDRPSTGGKSVVVHHRWQREPHRHRHLLRGPRPRATDRPHPRLPARVDYLIAIDAERTLLANQLSLAQAVNLQMGASIQLIIALGGGWNPSEDSQPRRAERGDDQSQAAR
jgi:hypothetical protein